MYYFKDFIMLKQEIEPVTSNSLKSHNLMSYQGWWSERKYKLILGNFNCQNWENRTELEI